MEVSRIILNIVSFKTFLSDQLHPVMMASISFICFLFLLGLTGAHPVAESRSYLFSFFTRIKKFRLGKYLLTFEGFFQLEGMKSRNLVNGQENEPRMQYDSIKALPPVNGMDDEPVRDLMNARPRGAHPVADESRSYLFSFFTRIKKFRLGKYLLTFEGFFQLEGMKSRNLVNGQENEPRMQYDSIKALPPVNGMDDEPVRDLMNAPPPQPRPLQGKSRSFSLHISCFCVYVSRCSWLQHIYSTKSGR